MDERRKKLLSKARDLLDKHYITGNWVRLPGGKAWGPGGMSHKDRLASLRKTLRIEKAANPIGDPNCQVCAEGAIYLACALDPAATEEDVRALLKHGRNRARKFGSPSIPNINDQGNKEMALRLLDDD